MSFWFSVHFVHVLFCPPSFFLDLLAVGVDASPEVCKNELMTKLSGRKQIGGVISLSEIPTSSRIFHRQVSYCFSCCLLDYFNSRKIKRIVLPVHFLSHYRLSIITVIITPSYSRRAFVKFTQFSINILQYQQKRHCFNKENWFFS